MVAYEPDPANADVHARTIALNGLYDRWELHRSAASTSDGQLRFRASGDALSHADERGELVVASADVLPVIAGVELLKMDIEGGEWAILSDSRFASDPPEVVVMEHHPQGAPGPEPRAAALEALAPRGTHRHSEHLPARRWLRDALGVAAVGPGEDILDSREAGPRIIRGGVVRGVGHVVNNLIALLGVILVTRYLGVADFGRFQTIISLITVVGTVTDAGMATLGMREYAQRGGAIAIS